MYTFGMTERLALNFHCDVLIEDSEMIIISSNLMNATSFTCPYRQMGPPLHNVGTAYTP